MPGTIDALVDLGLMPDQGIATPDLYEQLAELRASGEVARARWFGGQTALVITRYDGIQEAFKDEDLFSPRETRRVLTGPMTGVRDLSGLEGNEHRVYRALVSAPFRRDAVARLLAEVIRPLAAELVERLPRTGTADLVTALAKPLPLAVTIRMLGLPDDPRMDEWASAFINFGVDPEGGLRASRELTAVLAPIVADRRDHPRADLISLVANAEVDGEHLSDEDVCTFARMLFPAGADTTYMAMSSLFALLLSEPDRWARSVEDPSSRPLLVEEALRFEAPLVSMARVARRDGEFRGHPVPAGQMILLCLGMANRQPDVYPDAERYVPDRWRPGRDTRPHLGFGYANHFCLGATIARTEMVAALDALAEQRPSLRLAQPVRMLGSLMRRPDEVRVDL